LPLFAQVSAPAASPSASGASESAGVELARIRIDAMLRTGHADPSWFSSSFLAQISAAQVDSVIAMVIKTLGQYQRVEATPTRFIAHFAKGTDDILIHLDADMKIDGLLFKPLAPTAASLDDALRTLRGMPGTVSYAIIQEGRSEIAALNPSASLAVGSAFKLAVLNGLVDQIKRGRRHWSDVVALHPRWKSIPTSVLRDWPNGTPLTLATYAAEMISVSDNTAADALMGIVGPVWLRPYAWGNDPFLTTREMAILKSAVGDGLRTAYLSATTAGARTAVLRRVDALPLPTVNQLLSKPVLSIEWHYSTRQLCELMWRVARLPLMSINPGVADPAAFRRIAYKGGSDIGIINLTTLVTTKHGTRVCFSATENNAAQALDEPAFEMAYSAAMRFLASR
jgi:Beta-lactamase enzyme family